MLNLGALILCPDASEFQGQNFFTLKPGLMAGWQGSGFPDVLNCHPIIGFSSQKWVQVPQASRSPSGV